MLLDDESQDNNNGNVKIGSLALNQDDIITSCKFMNDDFISPTYRLDIILSFKTLPTFFWMMILTQWIPMQILSHPINFELY